MVRISVLTLECFLNAGELSETRLTNLQAAFAACEKTNLMARAFIGERATAIPCFRASKEEIERLSKAVIPENASYQVSKAAADATLQIKQDMDSPLFSHGTWFFERDLRYYLRVMGNQHRLGRITATRSLAAKDLFEKAPSDAKRNYYIFSRLLLPALSKTVVKEVECTACVEQR